MNDGRISVIIPCYNHAAELCRTLESLAVQTRRPEEVIVVDDGSTDDPSSVVKTFDGRLPIKAMRFDTNRGAPAARNAGARASAGEYLLFLDADAELVPVALEAFLSALTEHPEADFAYADFFWGKKLFRGRPFDTNALQKRNYIHTSSLMRREAFPGFDESLTKFQDWDLWLTMAERGSKGVWIGTALYHITPRKEGMSRWLPRVAHAIPWRSFGFQPKEIGRYREAEEIVRKKHGI